MRTSWFNVELFFLSATRKKKAKRFPLLFIWLTRVLIQTFRLKIIIIPEEKEHLSQREQNNIFLCLNNTLSHFMNSFTATLFHPEASGWVVFFRFTPTFQDNWVKKVGVNDSAALQATFFFYSWEPINRKLHSSADINRLFQQLSAALSPSGRYFTESAAVVSVNATTTDPTAGFNHQNWANKNWKDLFLAHT